MIDIEISMPVPVARSVQGMSIVADAAGIGIESSNGDDEKRIRLLKETT